MTVPSPGVLADVFWTGIFHILRRNCLLKQIIEGKIKGQIEVTRRRGRRRKKLLDDLKDRRGYSQLKEEALDRTMWRNRFGRGFWPVVWQVTDDDDDVHVFNCVNVVECALAHRRVYGEWRPWWTKLCCANLVGKNRVTWKRTLMDPPLSFPLLKIRFWILNIQTVLPASATFECVAARVYPRVFKYLAFDKL